jgi:colanic acid biosynthesis glycosyl transferase WcaI
MQASRYRAELGISDEVCVALYSGNMGEKQGLEIVLEVARQLQHEHDLLFVLCGEGAARGRLNELPNLADGICFRNAPMPRIW